MPADAPQVVQPIGPVHLQDLAAARGEKNTAGILFKQMLTLNMQLTDPYCGLSKTRNLEILIAAFKVMAFGIYFILIKSFINGSPVMISDSRHRLGSSYNTEHPPCTLSLHPLHESSGLKRMSSTISPAAL